ncbi:MAG: tRNA glutamyl-Q(34) synthetase GluQRS, partial [Acidimicrobiales bacterium]|nr:tRNA glutamyl-Q(34) synthetase GluQRS [Acidimicrobiales bacterium]
LDPAERSAREAAGRPAALRLDAHGARRRVQDLFHGEVEAVVDDFVVRRNDGVAAYNLAVVVDDADQGIEQVVRGDDLLLGTPRQALLCDLLELPVPAYAHVPLVLGPSGERLAKRDGAVTLADRRALGESAGAVCGLLAASLGLSEPGEAVHPRELIARFDPAALPRSPWLFDHPAPVHRNGGLTPD